MPERATPLRADVQGLRAVAVGLVLAYHLWPHSITGGFVGVDVFFVISGFLITAHLIAHPPRTFRDLAGFWSRRVRRLLPAALLVLVVTMIATRAVAPETQWERTAQQTRGAALYIVNWMLASNSVDYLAADDVPTPVQHFWSLSVEEQFYLAWPLLIAALIALGAIFARKRRTVILGLAAVIVTSLWYSLSATSEAPARAYFVTGARVWELGVGGLLAAIIARHGKRAATRSLPCRGREAVALVGLIAVAFAAFRFNGSTSFPGWRAALPVLGAAAVIAAATDAASGPVGMALATRPMQFLGDISYSVYLWHWPLIVLLAYRSGERGVLDDSAIIATSIVLATMTKRYVEDPFRAPAWGRPLRKPFALGAAGMAVVLTVALAQTAEIRQRESREEAQLEATLAAGRACFGAAALSDPTCPRTLGAPVVPSPAQAARDKSEAYPEYNPHRHTCWATANGHFVSQICTFGDPRAKTSIALTGNSHAGQWLPALEALATVRHWRITTFLASECALSDAPQRMRVAGTDHNCLDWVHRTSSEIAAGRFALVIMSNRMSVPIRDAADQIEAYRGGYERVLRQFSLAHVRVLVLRDTPAPGDGGVQSIPDCLASHPHRYAACAGTRNWIPNDPTPRAVAALRDPRIMSVDLDDHICQRDRCDGAVGGVVVYFDGSHLTATFAKTLAPYLRPAVQRALDRS